MPDKETPNPVLMVYATFRGPPVQNFRVLPPVLAVLLIPSDIMCRCLPARPFPPGWNSTTTRSIDPGPRARPQAHSLRRFRAKREQMRAFRKWHLDLGLPAPAFAFGSPTQHRSSFPKSRVLSSKAKPQSPGLSATSETRGSLH
jgi:hypothetical protein